MMFNKLAALALVGTLSGVTAQEYPSDPVGPVEVIVENIPQDITWRYFGGSKNYYAYVPGLYEWENANTATATIPIPSELAEICAVASHLVTITTKAENDFVTWLINNDGGSDIRTWIGCKEEGEAAENGMEDAFFWVNGEGDVTVPNKFNNWCLGEPNNNFEPSLLQGEQYERFCETNYPYCSTTDGPGIWNDRSFQDFPNQPFVIEVECCDAAGSCGDPHFTTWGGEDFDFHGECDLDLVRDPTFMDKGLQVMIRTKIRRGWSYISNAAIKIGDDILEVFGAGNEAEYWVNKQYKAALSTIGGFPVTTKVVNTKSVAYTIDLGDGHTIDIRTYKDFVRVDFLKPVRSLYGNSVGLLGDWNTGKKLARDGTTVINDETEFGMEWQALPNEPSIFHEVEGPQLPEQTCRMPEHIHAEDQRRRLGQRDVTQQQAEWACMKAGVSPADMAVCARDVMMLDDLDAAGAY